MDDDNSFFMCNSEDLDYDDPKVSPMSVNRVYSFDSNPSMLIINKGSTKRVDWSVLGSGKSEISNLKINFHSDNSLKISKKATWKSDEKESNS